MISEETRLSHDALFQPADLSSIRLFLLEVIEVTVNPKPNLKACFAERQLNLEKAFNLRHTQFDRKDDLPTARDMNEPIPTGPLAGWRMDEEKFNRMLDQYYDLHGWHRETSFPHRETLIDLGLEYVADDLQKIGKLR